MDVLVLPLWLLTDEKEKNSNSISCKQWFLVVCVQEETNKNPTALLQHLHYGVSEQSQMITETQNKLIKVQHIGISLMVCCKSIFSEDY